MNRSRHPEATLSTAVALGASALLVLVSTASCLGPGTLNTQQCEATGQQLIVSNCTSCHSAQLGAGQRSSAPEGVNFDTEGDIQRWATQIRDTTLVRKTMPPGAPLQECAQLTLDAYLSELEQRECIPSCSGRVCGDDGCGGSCGTCAEGESCDASYGQCRASSCTPDCTGAVCGDDGCGESCGTCSAGQACTAERACVCQPSCTNRDCGSDGCGGTCGSCPSRLFCQSTVTGSTCTPTCTPSCTGKVCGDDGCGGSCGACDTGQMCDLTGECVCAPQCSGKQCGDDGCGGTCGTCSGSATCVSNQCAYARKTYAADVHPLLQPSCASGGCHAGGPAEPMDFRTAAAGYASLVNELSTQCSNKYLVKPNDVAGSYLINKLTGQGMCSGSQMPKGRAALSPAELDTIRAWISTGADP